MVKIKLRRRARHDRRIRGRVRGKNGKVLRRARVRVLAFPYGSRKPFAKRTTKTNKKGRFTVRAPRGQACVVRTVVSAAGYRSRTVVVRFTGHPTLRLRAVRDRVGYGGVIELRGRITGDAGANVDRGVSIRALARSGWIPAGKTTIQPSGIIRWHYQLQHTRRPSDYRFRLRLAQRSDLPWRTVLSRPVLVRVRP